MHKIKTFASPLVLMLFSALLLLAISKTATAHLMVAQNGTLNFLDDDVYMVLSLPASAFEYADENGDGLLSIQEFTQHRLDIIDSINENVLLEAGKLQLPLSGIMVSPVTPHDAPKDPSEQLIVMGRFALNKTPEKLRFSLGLYGHHGADELSLKITASNKAENKKQIFELSSEKPTKLLFASQ